MHLANGGWWIFILILILVVTAVILFFYYRKSVLIHSLFSKNQQDVLLSNLNRRARLARTAALILAFAFISFSVLDPRWGTKNVQAAVEGIDVVLIMDLSRSMTTPDVSPNRLEYSKKLSVQLMNMLIGSRIGITAFAGYAFNVIPLTTDINAAALFLDQLSTDMIDVQGSNLEDAIKKAMTLFEKEAMTHKAIVLFTDGEDYEFNPMSQARLAKEKGISIFTVGIGTPAGGNIPLLDEQGNVVDYLKKNGQTVVSRLNDKLLADIARETRGISVGGNENSILTLAKKLDEIKKSRFGSNLYEFMEPQYQYFLLIGLLFLFIYLYLPERRLGKWMGQAALVALFVLVSGRSFASDASRGTGEYRKGNYDQALEYFQKAIVKDPKNKKILFNEGDTLMKLRQTDDAIRSFISLTGDSTNAENGKIRNKALFNLGNAYLEKSDNENAIQAYREVLENEKENSALYKKALNNLLYAKVQRQSQNQKDQEQDKKDENKKNNSQNPKDRKNNGGQPRNNQTKPISPSQVENLLSLIEEEEKKHLSKKERDSSIRVYPQNEW